ncbi:MurR/RpiR family transcriptional regulator [Roseovarius sp. CAU 1744]|uniref:MurR/RpiR family transcriptional regulator n=1 Tax=Roseovarius sp. CAU 1744 TaxID=3140368 RepID=UPI00325C1C77
MSARLREAGDFIAANPVPVATRSLRSVAGEAGLAPATFSRLARVLGYDGFEEIREIMRGKIDRRVNSFADRADRLWHDHEAGTLDLFQEHRQACLGNLATLEETIDREQLKTTVERLHDARKVLVLGALGSAGIAEYMHYMASFISDKWHMADRAGGSLGSGLAGMQKGDAIVILTKPPFARKALLAAEIAKKSGAFVIVITDSHACPALRFADTGFLVKSESPHFYSSYVATVFLAETMIGMLAGRMGPEATNRIADVENRNRRLEEVRDG